MSELKAPESAGKPLGAWRFAGLLSVGRYAPGCARLPDGRVVVAGGYSFERNRTHAGSDVFDPASERWTPGPGFASSRNFPLCASLPGGETLFLSGFSGRVGTTPAVDILTPDLRIIGGAPLVEERELADLTPLRDGRLLITGGYTTRRGLTLNTAEIYDPVARHSEATVGQMAHARFGHAGSLLPDGRVLLVGGKVLPGDVDVRPAELFDPATGQFSPAGELAVGRDRCTAWLLPSQRTVLVAGGSTKAGGTLPARTCELYDLETGRFFPGPPLLRDRMAHCATPLNDGRVLLTGGWSGSENRTTRLAEVWEPGQQRFVLAGELQAGRHDHGAMRLLDGRVLVAGGKEAPARAGVESPLEAELWTEF
jgi:hypothetical protein